MKAKELQTPIVQNIACAYVDYPFEKLDKQTLELIDWCRSQLGTASVSIPALIKLLECFLQITKQKVYSLDLSEKSFQFICVQFLGALNSDRFNCLSNGRRHEYSRLLLKMLTIMKQRIPELFTLDIELSHLGPTEYLNQCIKHFEELNLDEEKVWLWRGWPAKNRDGIVTWLQFYPLYQRLGRDFTASLHKICEDYYGSRKAQRIVGMSELALFIAKHPNKLQLEDFMSPAFITKFWREFFIYFIETGYAANVRITTLIKSWTQSFRPFVRDHLIPAGLIAEQYGELPSPEPRKVYGSQTHIKKTQTGSEIKVKLLTHVPLQATDQEAMELLFKEIQRDFDIGVDWAKWAADDIWRRYQRKLELSSQGQIRTIQPFNKGRANDYRSILELTDRANPDYLKNAAATSLHYGYVTQKDKNLFLLFPSPTSLTAYELALPVTGALLPHCILLVANHPSITPSFLEKFELWDKNEKLVGFVETDGGYILDGRKDRRGAVHAQQVIHLNDTTSKIVQQMIELTAPLRQYLKERGDDNWRYLLLTSGKGFSYPGRIKRLATDTSHPRRLKALADGLANTSNLSLEQRMEYVQRFSLPALRASAGVLIYIKSRSVTKMAEALGHVKYQADLLSNYLPEPILAFFQERWIRIFQTGIIVEALKDSEYLLEASNFTTMEELHQFLDTHALKKIPKHLEDPDALRSEVGSPQDSDTEVVFGVNAGILTIMLSLQQAVSKAIHPVSGRAIYWSGITEHLTNYIESKDCNREDLKGYLSTARDFADPNKMENLIYE